MQGLGSVFLEHLRLRRERRSSLTGSLADYLLPTASDFGHIRGLSLGLRPCPNNPLGAKGAGEGGLIAVGGVIANAIAAALALPLGAAARHAAVAAAPVAPDRRRPRAPVRPVRRRHPQPSRRIMHSLPKISLRLHGGMRPAECVELARAAEAAGFAGIWFAENAFGARDPAGGGRLRGGDRVGWRSMPACSIRSAAIPP